LLNPHKFCFAGAGNRDWRRAHFVHHFQNRIAGRGQSVQGSRRTALLLLLGARSQMFGVLADWSALQDQTDLSCEQFDDSTVTVCKVFFL
jgi:hypothetical protein